MIAPWRGAQANSDNEGAENGGDGGDHSRGTATRRVPQLEREREIDQMKRAMEEMKDSMRRANHVDDLIHKTDSSKFKMPTLDSYDGARDPCDHIATFKTTMHLQGVPDEIMCKVFPTILHS